ncbi:MAG: hypothetical protein PHY02_01175 [Phycisphaerae bacterium]|nr:hypothetical protein [Phycisphaerae bacterium]
MSNASIKSYMQPAFLICAAILAVAGGGMSVAVKSLGIYLKKEPWPLKKSLDLLDEKGLPSYKVISKEKIKSGEVIDSLGTEDYIQWVLEDLDVPSDSPVRYCSLFITYYELPDKVPHVPEECYMGSGFQKLASESVSLEVRSHKIPARYLVFTGTDSNYWQKSKKFSILYFFSVNNIYADNRGDARLILNKNIRGKHSYFCKVEWKFFNTGFSAGKRSENTYPDKEEAITASQKLLDIILPILEKEHWPIWKKEGAAGNTEN